MNRFRDWFISWFALPIFAVASVLIGNVVFAADKKPIDADCAKMATNARGFAELKQGGIATSPADLMKFVVTPNVASYPIRSVLQFVMNAPDPSPEQVYNSLYLKCTMMGYKDLFAYFQEREESDGLKIQIAEQNMTIAQLRAQVAGLTAQVTDLKYPSVPQRRVAQQSHVVASPPPTIPAPPAPAVDTRRTLNTPPGCFRQDGSPCASK